MAPPRHRSFWDLKANEVRTHAFILAGVLWIAATLLLASGTRDRDALGQLKGNDFVHFYTLGQAAWARDAGAVVDPTRQHELQVALVPASARERYLPAYPPQTAVLFAPLARLPYRAAWPTWAIVTMVGYGWAVWWSWRRTRAALTDRLIVAAAAAAFPPFWNLVLNGQSTLLPLLAFTGGAAALWRGRRFLAGLILGLLFVKPQLGLVLAAVVLAGGELAMLAGLVLSLAVQAGAAAAVFGWEIGPAYLRLAQGLPAAQQALEPRAALMHSIATVTGVLPGTWAVLTWAILSAFVTWLVVRTWRSRAPVLVKCAVLVIGSVLVSPHVNLYDVTVLAPAVVWLAGWFESAESGPPDGRFRLAIYLLFLTLLFPTAALVGIQASPFVMVWMLVLVRRRLGREMVTAASRAVP